MGFKRLLDICINAFLCLKVEPARHAMEINPLPVFCTLLLSIVFLTPRAKNAPPEHFLYALSRIRCFSLLFKPLKKGSQTATFFNGPFRGPRNDVIILGRGGAATRARERSRLTALSEHSARRRGVEPARHELEIIPYPVFCTLLLPAACLALRAKNATLWHFLNALSRVRRFSLLFKP